MTDSTKDDKTPNDAPKQDQDALADDWAAALSEQHANKEDGNQAKGLAEPDSQPEDSADPTGDDPAGAAEDDWAAALAEQTAASNAQADDKQAESRAKPAPDLFQPLSGDPNATESDIDMIRDIPVQMSVELGRTRLTIQNILQLGQGSVVELDGLAGEPMDIYVNGYLIAQGEVVVVDDKYGIRITDIITPSDRIQRLNNRR